MTSLVKEHMTVQRQPITVIHEKVFQWCDYPLFISLTVISNIAICYFLWRWFSLKDWRSFPVLFSIATIVLLAHLFVNTDSLVCVALHEKA
jgi:hypothetical protein